jgi:hypothetical protein
MESSAMNFNLFLWIREGVKQSVLLGVSDAIEAIGTPENSEDITPRLLDFMRGDSSETPSKTGSRSSKRKRLGKSLRDLESASNA